MKIIKDKKRIDEILERGVIAEILPDKKQLRNKLLSGERLSFYLGADPTAPALHLGHAQNLMLLEDLRKLGHKVIFLIGDFTGMIGDPTDKSATRQKLSSEKVKENFSDWKNQIKNILNFDDKENPVEIRFNSEWLGKLSFAEILELASNFTVQQMLERDMFEKRIKNQKPVYLHEFLYPLMQGYDSVVLDVDAELCGTDQIFNALAGRTLMQKLKKKEKFIIATNLIADEKTGELMSKSNGTGVFLNLSPNDLFGAIMAQSDGMIKPLLIGCTRISLKEIKEILQLKNPRDAKIRLAKEIVKIFHGKELAQKAEQYFIATFSKKQLPSQIDLFSINETQIKLIDFLVKAHLAQSKSEARRKIEQGGVKINQKKVTQFDFILTQKNNQKDVIQVGKKNFKKIFFGKN